MTIPVFNKVVQKAQFFRGAGRILNGAITVSCIDQNSCAEPGSFPSRMQSDPRPELIHGERAFLHHLGRRVR